MKLVGIDPGLTCTALMYLDFEPPDGRRLATIEEIHGRLRVLERENLRSSPKVHLYRRLHDIYEGVMTFVANAVPIDAIAIEDPSADYAHKPSSLCRLGSAFAAALLGAQRGNLGLRVATVPATDWIPKTYVRSIKAPRGMKHNDMKAQLRERYPVLNDCTDDQVFAAGMVIWHAFTLVNPVSPTPPTPPRAA